MTDIDRQIEILQRCELIKEEEVKVLCEKAKEILSSESNVQRLSPPITVCSMLFSWRTLFKYDLRFVGIFMDSFMILRSFLRLVVTVQKRTICSLVTL